MTGQEWRMDNEIEVVEERGPFRWIFVAIFCWLTSAFSRDAGVRSVLLGLGMYFNVIFIERFLCRQKFDCLIVRLSSAIVFMLPCVIATLVLLNRFPPEVLNGTKPVLLLSPIVYGVMFYLGVYVSEKLKCPNWLASMIILLCMFFAGIFRMSAFLMYPASYGFMLTSAFGLIAMLTCIVCGGIYVSSKNVIVFSGLLLIVSIFGFMGNAHYGGEYKSELFCADKHNPEILKNLDYTLAVRSGRYTKGRPLLFIFNKAGLKDDNLEVIDVWIYNMTTKKKIARLIFEDNNNEDSMDISADLTLKLDRKSNEIHLENKSDKKKILIANGYSPSYAENIKRIFYIKDRKVYSKNLSGKDEKFHCKIDQQGKNWNSFSFVSPDGKFLLYDGVRTQFPEGAIFAVLELSSGKSHLIPREYCWKVSRWTPKAWISKKLLTKDAKQ